MPRQTLALALCRVSSIEQLENNSLNRQRDAVLNAAKDLGVTIPSDGWWSGSVSSKRGTNVERKDLQQMIDRCKKDKHIKFVIVDEPDRFMRSIDEAAFFEVTFRQLGVTVWYASDPELNKGDLASKLLKFTKYLSAEGSNEERQHKSIAGQTKALPEGRYPFPCKPGYVRGYQKAIHEIDKYKGPLLQQVMLRIISREVTPTQGLIELNKSGFIRDRALYKMDKFRKILVDPFYAGILEINKQVNVRNENGLHEPLITKEQHYELIKIMDGKKKNQAGPRKNGNPKYPLNNLITHQSCEHLRYGRLVGVDINNGKNKNKVYEKYRCRECKQSIPRDELHLKITQLFKGYRIYDEALGTLIEALNEVWKQREGQAEQNAMRIKRSISKVRQSIANSVEAAMDPSNIDIKLDILASISKKKLEVASLEDELDKTLAGADTLKEDFVRFAFKFLNNMGEELLDLSQEDRQRCKQIIFPSGFRIDENKNVYTPEVSPLYRLVANKKDLPMSEKSFMVRVRRL